MEKQVSDNNDIFFYIYNRIPKILDDITYNILISNLKTKKKFAFFKYYKNDLFLNKCKYQIIERQFMICQNIYMSLCRLVYIYKLNKKKNNNIYNKDLLFNPLNQYKQNLIFYTIEYDIPYNFLVNDILKIIKKSLTYNIEFFIEAYKPRNPYTNIAFSYAFLVNFYNYLKINNINTGIIFELYYKSNLNIKKYVVEYESLIRDEIIKDYYINYTANELYSEILYIIKYYKRNTNIYINCNYDKKEIIKIFKPIMIPHLNVFYSDNKQKMYKNKRYIIKFLNDIEKNYSSFGFKGKPEYNMINVYYLNLNNEDALDAELYYDQL